MSAEKFELVRRAITKLNEGLDQVEFLEELLDEFADLLELATTDGTIDPWSLSQAATDAIIFLQRMFNQLDYATRLGAPFDTPFWPVGDREDHHNPIPELGGRSIEDITADLVAIDSVALLNGGKGNNPGGYILLPQTVAAYEVLRSRYQPEPPSHVQDP